MSRVYAPRRAALVNDGPRWRLAAPRPAVPALALLLSPDARAAERERIRGPIPAAAREPDRSLRVKADAPSTTPCSRVLTHVPLRAYPRS
ncbi:hypothetical protein [Haliangium ochraceum]|uniref:Uncharacterized protein n=1 Tax=Haliangium ochraceum (strain DSM 14365 / JCM 11303 / SMP-2) TaxID=502025 RepID=D0LSE2_HALO1|nr:hypothetical protein [Haliangium ochraceum]ACY15641.1 hypothetical protein Hoch_3139 [Haliangium ochraceum DSM 14365]